MSAKPFIDIHKQIEQGIAVLHRGGLVAYPTDTVYGLGAAMNMPLAVERIYAVKGRSPKMPLPLLLADVSQIAEVAAAVPPSGKCFIRNFFPGPLTLILPKSRAVPAIVTGGGDTVAVRVPDHPVPVALIKGLGCPIVGTSANLSGRPSSLTADDAAKQLGDKVDLIIDGGHSPGGRESTIVDVTGEMPVILREGAISSEELKRVCGNIMTGKETKKMRVAVGADHRGFELKKKVIQIVANAGHTCDDLGTYGTESVDYPEISKKVADAVASGSFDKGILICDTGIGVCIAANKVKGIRAALCHNAFSACRARQHNDANVLCLAVENGVEAVEEVVKSFLACEFEGGRHERRVNQIKSMEGIYGDN